MASIRKQAIARLLGRIDAFNARHPWSHNEFYHRWILRQVPAGADRVLDVGCGTGDLVRKLARASQQCEGADRDPSMIEIAQDLSSDLPNAQFRVAELEQTPRGSYDAITAVAVVHHVQLRAALGALRNALTARW